MKHFENGPAAGPSCETGCARRHFDGAAVGSHDPLAQQGRSPFPRFLASELTKEEQAVWRATMADHFYAQSEPVAVIEESLGTVRSPEEKFSREGSVRL